MSKYTVYEHSASNYNTCHVNGTYDELEDAIKKIEEQSDYIAKYEAKPLNRPMSSIVWGWSVCLEDGTEACLTPATAFDNNCEGIVK